MSMSHHDQINQWHEVQIKTRLALAFDDAVPLCPIGVNDHRMIGKLNKKRGVPNPCNTNFSCFRRVGNRFFDRAITFLKSLGEQSMPEEMIISTGPAFFG